MALQARFMLVALALATSLALVAGGARAQEEYPIGEAFDPVFGVADGAFEDADRDAPRPLLPFLGIVRDIYEAARDSVRTLVVGFGGGDAGTDAGTPDAVGVVVQDITVVDGVRVPPVVVTLPPRSIPIGTPAIDQTIHVPGVTTPRIERHVPPMQHEVVVPGVSTPPMSVVVPAIEVVTPAVRTPAVNASTPSVVLPGDEVCIEHGRLGARFDGMSGTLYLGAAGSVPYEVPPVAVQVGDLTPDGVPDEARVERGALVNESARPLVDEPSRTLLESQRVHVTDGARVDVPGVHVSDPVHVATLSTPGAHVVIGSVSAGGQSARVAVDGVPVTTVHVPGVTVQTPPVVVHDDPVVVPGQEVVVEEPLPVDDLGYVGYGRDRDSSLYPYLCGAATGCLRTEAFVRPYVDFVDTLVDAYAARADGRLVVDVTPERPA